MSPFSRKQLWLPVLYDDELTLRWAISHDNSDVFLLPRGTRSGVGSVDCVFRLGSWEERPFGLAGLLVEMKGGISTANDLLTCFRITVGFKRFQEKAGLQCAVTPP
jgi:hypothetical protein